MLWPRASREAIQRGLSLIELMVAMAIGLVVVLAVTSLIVVSQTQERNTGGSNDMNQGSAYAATVLDQAVRSAGAGFAQGWDLGALGCLPHLSRNGSALLPRTAALPAPFAGLLGGATGTANLRMAPVLIGQGQSEGGSDILMVMSGSAAIGDVPRRVRDFIDGSSTESRVRVDTTLALHPNDVLLLSRPESEACVVTQVKADFEHTAGNDVLPLGGDYYRETADGSNTLQTVTGGGESFITGLGNTGSGNLSLQLFGVGANRVLSRYDLLQTGGTDEAQAVAEGVVAMRAIYSVDANIDDRTATPAPTWTEPAGDYAIGTLLSSSALDRARALRRIVGVRVSLLVRSSARQSQLAAPESVVMLAGLPGEQTVTLSEADRHHAHRLVETTIPLRNALMVQPELEP
ncbi:PilW family protein [Xenophilus sp. Marseille-Q4582]|uniref:PilW family protein n=1 Tax=Xenophilus sp. Marseille-Q4582 TaxID=2866600 RepID=UPI001CE4AA67|nr:PilW family protein [Xenophilus sp. Marseille-Q4582]